MTEVEQLITDCVKRKSKLNFWENDFINNLYKIPDKARLSLKQIEKLEGIWEKIT